MTKKDKIQRDLESERETYRIEKSQCRSICRYFKNGYWTLEKTDEDNLWLQLKRKKSKLRHIDKIFWNSFSFCPCIASWRRNSYNSYTICLLSIEKLNTMTVSISNVHITHKIKCYFVRINKTYWCRSSASINPLPSPRSLKWPFVEWFQRIHDL
jgi:hypothetical protein